MSRDPRQRLILCLLFALLVAVIDRPVTLLVMLLLAVGLVVVERVPLRLVGRRLLAVDGLMLVAIGGLPLTMAGAPVASIAGWAISREGLMLAQIALLKANAVALALLALLGRLEPVAIGHGLARLGLSPRLVMLFLLTVRYLDVLTDEYRRLRLAMRARGFAMGFNRHCWRSLGYLIGMLLVRGLERAERIDAAMRCRGFDGTFPLLEPEAPAPSAQRVWWGAGVAGAALLLVWDRV